MEDLKLYVRPDASRFLTNISRFLAEEGIRSYLVGGFVRDMLLGRDTSDIDIAVDADALAVAPKVAGAFGGTGKLGEMGWYRGNADGRTRPVASKAANAWGLYDMHGNVAEWCSDFYDSTYPDGPATDPTGPTEGKLRVIRGGSWRYFPAGCRSAARSSQPPAHRLKSTGLRVVLETNP